MVDRNTFKKTKAKHKSNPKLSKGQLSLKNFNFNLKLNPSTENTGNTGNVNFANSANHTQPAQFLNNNQFPDNSTPDSGFILIKENPIVGDSIELPDCIKKLIKDNALQHAKLKCAISNYKNQIAELNKYKDNPELHQIPQSLKFIISKILNSNLPQEDRNLELNRIFCTNLNKLTLKLLEIENLSKNFVAHLWNETLLPALEFAVLPLTYDAFSAFYESILQNTLFNFYLKQQKHKITKQIKTNNFEKIKEDKLQQINLTKGDLTQLTNKLNQLSLQVQNLKTENAKLNSKLLAKKDQGGRMKDQKKVTSSNSKNLKSNTNKSNTVRNKKSH